MSPMPPMSRTERAALCNAALEAGETAPTLCGDWTVKDLVIHLLVRERDPVGAPGIVFSPLQRLTDWSSRRLASEDFATLVERVRSGPPRWSPMSVGTVDRTMNTLEYFVHHEDIRRAAPGWSPRELTEREQRVLWKSVSVAGKGMVRPAGVPVELRWAGEEGETGRTATLRSGADPVVVTGSPAEIVLFCFSRSQNVGLELSGPPDSVQALAKGRLEP